MQEAKGSLGVPMEISSPITSDEEYLSPLEEAMDFGVQESRRTTDSLFREPPAFLVRAFLDATNLVHFILQLKPCTMWIQLSECFFSLFCFCFVFNCLFFFVLFWVALLKQTYNFYFENRFRQVTMKDQAVIEGQEVTMSVRISGQPKPMLYW